jgi:hypothetical protein
MHSGRLLECHLQNEADRQLELYQKFAHIAVVKLYQAVLPILVGL